MEVRISELNAKLCKEDNEEIRDELNCLIREFADSISKKYTDLRYRAKNLYSIVGTKAFKKEFQDIRDCITDYEYNEKKCGWRRARRYAITNRIHTLINEKQFFQRGTGYIWNKIEGRDDEQFMNMMEDIEKIIRCEFHL